jgi:phenylpropionate dioxygenase-like ring-hydroxylating dioxygenase large terminal subunit
MAHVNPCRDSVLLNDWHVVADRAALTGPSYMTRLLGVDLAVRSIPGEAAEVVRADSGQRVLSAEKYGFVWACLGTPGRDIIEIPEAAEPDRHLVSGGSIGVKVSGLRAVENFLDMGHFPFVHTGWLGIEPHTEVTPYNVSITDDGEVLATECKFFQPVASPNAEGGFVVDYTYRVIRPYTVSLYKSNPIQQERRDSIYLFVQPVDEESCIAHSFLCYLTDNMEAATVRWFMQLIFA